MTTSRGLAELAASMPELEGFQVLPYHRFGTSKLERFGIEDDLLGDVAPPEKETVTGWVNRLAELGLPIINGTQDT